MKRSGDRTHHCPSPRPTLNRCDWTSEQEYSYFKARKRHPSTPYSHNNPQSFSRGTQLYAFSRSTKHVIFGILPRILKILLERANLVCSATAAMETALGIIQLGSINFVVSRHALFQGDWAKRCPGSWFIHSSSFLCIGIINLPIFRCPSKTTCHFTHESAKPSCVLSYPNSLSNFSQ